MYQKCRADNIARTRKPHGRWGRLLTVGRAQRNRFEKRIAHTVTTAVAVATAALARRAIRRATAPAIGIKATGEAIHIGIGAGG